MNNNRDKIVLDSVLDGVGFKELAKKFDVSISMIRVVFYRQVKRAIPELFLEKTPPVSKLRRMADEIKEKNHERLVSPVNINIPDVSQQISDAIRLLIDIGYTVKK